MARLKQVLWIVGAVVLTGILTCAGVFGPCWSAWLFDGILVWECPAGAVHPVVSVEVTNLGRKDPGAVNVGVVGHYWSDAYGSEQTARVRRFSNTVLLVPPEGEPVELVPEKRWKGFAEGWQSAAFRLPAVPDGDYVLRVLSDTAAGDATVDVALPLYVPALSHVLSDAPLYKPGQTMRFRAVLLGEDDLVPLEGRPGTWRVLSPEGETFLEEKGKTGPFGVAESNFPLDPDAPPGLWTIQFVSGAAIGTVTPEVRAFQLPRFTVTASSPRPAWHIGDSPVVKGVVHYTSGAPVVDAEVTVRPFASGAWPPPTSWMDVRTLRTDAAGHFSIALGVVPGDLRDVATLGFQLDVVDETGASASGSASVLLAEDSIGATALTELADGLVASANNRVYVRVTRPEGDPLPGATVHVSKAWDPKDPGLDAVADDDGVARFQLDPGEPITVVVPPMPVRPRPRVTPQSVQLLSANDALDPGGIDLAEQSTLDRLRARLAACADRVRPQQAQDVDLVVLYDAAGGARQVTARTSEGEDALARCFADVAQAFAVQAGPERLWSTRWSVADPMTPWVSASPSTLLGSDPGISAVLDERLRRARACVADETESRGLGRKLAWRVSPGSTAVELTWADDPTDDGRVDAQVRACVVAAVPSLKLSTPASERAAGIASFDVQIPYDPSMAAPQATTFPGFELSVKATVAGREVGHTRLRLAEGAIPALRLRASEVIVDPGATVELTAIRGDGFTGSFPEKVWLMQGDRSLVEFPFDPETRRGKVKIPEGASGFVHVSIGGARAVVYVRPKATLQVALSSDAASYRPGQIATLTVLTYDGASPVAAGLTLSGVDATLASLAPLPGPDSFAAVTVRATSDAPAFGVMDARALQTGRIRGENAAQAAVLRVTGLPVRAPGADRVSASAEGAWDPNGLLADSFYALYAHARAEVRGWEEKAPAGEMLSAKKMVQLWDAALAANPATDPWGRPLRLANLPPDLLSLTDPRFMVSDGARLPEDVENWTAFVASGGT